MNAISKISITWFKKELIGNMQGYTEMKMSSSQHIPPDSVVAPEKIERLIIETSGHAFGWTFQICGQ